MSNVVAREKKNNKLRTDLGFMKETSSIIIKDVSEISESDFFLHMGIQPTDSPLNLSGKERFIEKLIKEKQKFIK